MLQYTTDRNTSVSMSAHDRSSPHRGLVLRPDGCNIAPGTAPALEAVAEAFQSFHKKFSAADFSPHLRRASCTFVCRKVFRHTKVLALRGRVAFPSHAT